MANDKVGIVQLIVCMANNNVGIVQLIVCMANKNKIKIKS